MVHLEEILTNRFMWWCVIWQGLMLLFFGLFSTYAESDSVDPLKVDGFDTTGVGFYYPFFQDVHVMIFVGFGFLMTFMKRNGFNSVGFNFLLGALVIQWNLLCRGFFEAAISGEHRWYKLTFDTVNLIAADYCAGAILISYGGVLGKVSPLQLSAMAFWEVIVYALNEALCVHKFKSVDMGGSMYIHTFGAYFGLTVSMIVSDKEARQDKQNSIYHSDLFAMIGTLFLWMFWPSFNGALAGGQQQHRVIVNTVLALCASCVTTFVLSGALRHNCKFDMVDIQNATLAGGVAVGCSSDLVIRPWGAVLIGIVAGAISCLGYIYLQPFLEKKIGLHDSCGIHNLHGMPGVLGALGGIVSSSVADEMAYGTSIGKVFPARAPSDPVRAAAQGVAPGDDRSASTQAWYQLAALLLSLGLAIAGGIFTGLFIKYVPFFQKVEVNDYYEDSVFWNSVPEEGSRDFEMTGTNK